LRLSSAKTEQEWAALQAARWSRAVALCGTILGLTVLAQDWPQVLHLYEAAMAPAAWIDVLEDLIREGCLSLAPTRRIEEAIVAKTTASGERKCPRDLDTLPTPSVLMSTRCGEEPRLPSQRWGRRC
jgi:hypothetical protein